MVKRKNRAHGSGHITTVTEGQKYRVRVTHGTKLNGKPRSISETVTGTRAQAEARAAVLYEQLKQDTARGAGVTLQEYYEQVFIPNKKKQGSTQTNLNGYSNMFKHLPQTWKKQQLREPAHAEIQALLNGDEFRGHKNGRAVYHTGAAKQFIKYFKALLRAAWKDGLLSVQPCLIPYTIPKQPHASGNIWDEAETAAAWLLLRGHRLEAYVLIGGAAGTRREETIPLQWDDIEFNINKNGILYDITAYVTIDKALTEEDGLKDTKNEHSSRIIPICGYPARRLYEIRKETGAILENLNGNQLKISGLQRQWCNLWNAPADLRFSRSRETRHRKAGVLYEKVTRITPNALRHSSISMFSELGINDSTNQKYHGHAPRTIETRHYIRRYNKALQDAAELIAMEYEHAGEFAIKHILNLI